MPVSEKSVGDLLNPRTPHRIPRNPFGRRVRDMNVPQLIQYVLDEGCLSCNLTEDERREAEIKLEAFIKVAKALQDSKKVKKILEP